MTGEPTAGASCTLADLEVGQHARVEALDGASAIVQRLLEMGITKGVEVSVVRFAPLGDPMEVKVRGYLLSLRRADARAIRVGT